MIKRGGDKDIKRERERDSERWSDGECGRERERGKMEKGRKESLCIFPTSSHNLRKSQGLKQ